MKLTQKQVYDIIKIVVTAVLSVAATLLAQSCTVSLSVSKNNQSSPVRTEQTAQVQADSTAISLKNGQ